MQCVNLTDDELWGALGIPMQCVNLTDDELWRVIAENTNAMSQLVHRQLELDASIATNDPHRGHLMRFFLQRASVFQRQYQECTTELRRRYPLGVKILKIEISDRPTVGIPHDEAG
jgi:hypothetical protein